MAVGPQPPKKSEKARLIVNAIKLALVGIELRLQSGKRGLGIGCEFTGGGLPNDLDKLAGAWIAAASDPPVLTRAGSWGNWVLSFSARER